MKVLFFVDGTGGGATTHVLALAKGITNYGFEPALVFFLDGPSVNLAREYGLNVRLLLWRFDLDFTLAWKLRQILQRERVDILHTHTITGNFYGRWAACLLRRRPILVSTVHSHVIDELKGTTQVSFKDYLRYKREIYTQGLSRHFIAVSDKIGRRIIEHGADPEKVTVINNGIEVPEPSLVEEHARSVRQEFNFTPDDVLIGIVGRLVPLKNHSFFLQLAKELEKTIPRLKFLVVGDGELLESLTRLAHELGINKSVVFTGWRNDNLRIVSALDVMVLCSETEGLNVSILEAMACGRPVVGSKVSGIKDVVVDGKTGFLAPVRDMEAFRASLERLIADKELRERMGQQAREHVRANYSFETMVGRTVDVYKRMMAGTVN